ncbi:MAG: insulinase family protein [Candidatus Eisenbacteria bacterium]|uniref:Insulinase family protein n=1 Tax=Eiseniibacteriota bacterium TaxID=2212470 RepID=A0A538TZX7_UNCEI|nr:MAG: insulinase family protein [Candidatus Eisenbacteria bacterium]
MMPRKLGVWTAVLALVSLASTAAAAKTRPKTAPAAIPTTPAAAITPARFPVEKHTLGNGLVVLLHEDHSVPAVTFWQWYRVGSRNESPGITGISHVFEHMMFNGSKSVPPKEYDRVIESNGGTSNAFTDRDMTAYDEDIASSRLEVLFRLDSDRMRGLLLGPEQMKSEMEVVKEERRLHVDNDIAGLLIGWMTDLEHLQRAQLVDYFRTYYAPNNCILVLTGDFDSRAALALITKSFGDIPAQPPPPPPATGEPPQTAERRAEVRYPAENVSFDVGYKAPGAASDDAWVLDILDSILGDGESSRLHRALIYDQGLALEAGSFFRSRLASTLFEFFVEMKPGKSAREGEAALDQVVDRLVKDGPTERELEKAKNLLEAGLVKSLKTNNGAGEELGFYEHVFGDYRTLYRTVDRYRRISIEDCRRVARAVFVPERRTVVELVPTPVGERKP